MSGFAVAAYWEGQANAKRFDRFADACACFNQYAAMFTQGRHSYMAYNASTIIAVVACVDDLMRRLALLDSSDKKRHFQWIERFAVDFAGGFDEDV